MQNSNHVPGIMIYKQHWNLTDNMLNLFLHVELPLNQLVFTKDVDHFYSNLIYTLILHNLEKDIQIYRQSWNEKVIQSYYEQTRNKKNYFSTEKNIQIIPGEYKLFLNIQDKDNQKNWKINNEFVLEKIKILGPVLPLINNGEYKKIVANNIVNEVDTIWLRSQIFFQDGNSNVVNYSISKKSIEIDTGEIVFKKNGINNLYLFPIPFNEKKNGWYEITLSFEEVIRSTSIHYGMSEGKFWTDDLNELIGVMYYVMSADSISKILKNMDEASQLDYIRKHWNKLDPTSTTEENELLMQLNKRVRYVNNNYSVLIPGWRTDRGKIYIIHGPPQYKESYQDEMGNNYQKWIYSTGKQFIFIDRSFSGDFTLFRGIY